MASPRTVVDLAGDAGVTREGRGSAPPPRAAVFVVEDEDGADEGARSAGSAPAPALPAPAPAFGLLIMSFNCGAWMKTIKELPDGPGGRAAVWFERHGVDIVCVQEVKVNAERVALDHTKGKVLCTETGEYESFSAPSRDPASNGRQGCTTWARKGLTLSADAAPLGAPEVDMLGRCIVTEHRAFVLFNVYGPRRGKGVAERLQFWDLLRRAMRARRLSSGGKPVVLCGDLNIRTSVLDTSALELRVPENPFAAARSRCLCGLCVAGGRCEVLEQLRAAWPSVLQFAPPHVPGPFQGDGDDLCSGEELAALLRQLGVAWCCAASDRRQTRRACAASSATGCSAPTAWWTPSAASTPTPRAASRRGGCLPDGTATRAASWSTSWSGRSSSRACASAPGCAAAAASRTAGAGAESRRHSARPRVAATTRSLGPPQTGLVYTPHLCSDHVPVTLLLDEAALLRVAERLQRGAAAGDVSPLADAVPLADRIKLALHSCELSRDARTAEAQPHKQRQQQLLTGFFPAAAAQPHAAAEGSKRRCLGT